MKPQVYSAITNSIEQLTSKVYRVNFSIDQSSYTDKEKFTFIPGQFVTINVADKIRRSYSISSIPEDDFLKTYIDISPMGPGSQFFLGLSTGEKFKFIGPLGYFIDKSFNDGRGSDVFLATGTGITPLISIIRSRLLNDHQNKSKRKVVLYWGLRSESDIFLKHILDELEMRYSQFEYYICLSQPKTLDWNGLTGYANDNYFANQERYQLDSHWQQKNHYYICGGGEFISSTKKSLLEASVHHKNIHFEKFF